MSIRWNGRVEKKASQWKGGKKISSGKRSSYQEDSNKHDQQIQVIEPRYLPVSIDFLERSEVLSSTLELSISLTLSSS